MDRRLIAGLVGLVIAGCAQAKSAMPRSRQGNAPPIEETDLPPIKDVINRAGNPVDGPARKASTPGPTSPRPALPPLQPPGDPTAGRPVAPGEADGMPRLQAPPGPGRPEDQPPEARPAPFVAQPPPGPRPQPPPAGRAALDAPGPALQGELPPPVGALPSPAAPPMTDAAVVPTSAPGPDPKPPGPDPRAPDPKAPVTPPRPPVAGRVTDGQAARVGDEIITFQQVQDAMKEKLLGSSPEQRDSPEYKKLIFDYSLEKLIARSLIVQAAKKKMKDAKALESIYESIDKEWMEQEMPPLLREYQARNIHELKRKMTERGRSLDQIREDFRLDGFMHAFMAMSLRLQDRTLISFRDMHKYYNEHINEFNLPESLVWSEVEVDIAKCKGRAEARARADALLARLRKGEDFARVARAESHGATARDGGHWATATNPSANPDINRALAALKPGQIGDVIEVPGAFHILRVESRRAAGPARLDEVQDQIKVKLTGEKQQKLINDFIASIRAKTTVTTAFDPPEPDPAARAGGDSPPAR